LPALGRPMMETKPERNAMQSRITFSVSRVA
jgi:hypothetical protein